LATFKQEKQNALSQYDSRIIIGPYLRRGAFRLRRAYELIKS
jgi:hypothetical protein